MSVQLRRLADVNPPTPEFGGVDDDVTFLPLEAVWSDGHRRYDETKPAGTSGYTQFRRGDILMPKITPTFEAGRVFVADDLPTPVGLASTEVHAIRPRDVDPRYLAYFLRSLPVLTEGHESLRGVGNLRRVTTEWVEALQVPVVDAVEQAGIADYLDRETARIDALIEKQRVLLVGFAARRIAVIRHAVRDSNPWPSVAIRRLFYMRPGSAFPYEYQGVQGDEISFYKVKALGSADDRGVLSAPEDTISRETATLLRASVFPEGTLVMAKIGAALLLGRVRTVPGPSAIDNNMLALTPTDAVDPRYGFYSLQGLSLDALVQPGAVPSLNERAMRQTKIPLPPLTEQREIADCLDRETTRIDTLIAKAERFIELAQERRAALITAAVTGQLQIPAQENNAEEPAA